MLHLVAFVKFIVKWYVDISEELTYQVGAYLRFP